MSRRYDNAHPLSALPFSLPLLSSPRNANVSTSALATTSVSIMAGGDETPRVREKQDVSKNEILKEAADTKRHLQLPTKAREPLTPSTSFKNPTDLTIKHSEHFTQTEARLLPMVEAFRRVA